MVRDRFSCREGTAPSDCESGPQLAPTHLSTQDDKNGLLEIRFIENLLVLLSLQHP